uniref:hypothetical protein n=1 Tax=Ningiella ruwaisensis TaxID=2364274 RepID=UPI00109FAA4A|nr:hypothetical protein [Ningiella ruwaisensis]
MNTQSAYRLMHQTGRYYSASELAGEMGVTAKEASGYLYNIRNSKSLVCDVTPLPNRKVKVVKILKGEYARSDLWRLAIFGKTA